jgi:ribosomal protein L22
MAEPKKDAKDTASTKSAATKTAAGSSAKKAAAKPKSTTSTKAKPKAAPKTAKKPTASTKSAATKTAAGSTAATKKAEAAEKEAPQRPVVNARARYVRIAPRKARLIADQVRGLPLEDAQTLLRFSPRGAARDISKLIDSAVANAETNHDLVADDLLIKEVRVDEGPTLRRYRPRALGRATRINKRTSHIQVALTPEE